MDLNPNTMMWLELAIDAAMVVVLWRILDRLTAIIMILRVRDMARR